MLCTQTSITEFILAKRQGKPTVQFLYREIPSEHGDQHSRGTPPAYNTGNQHNTGTADSTSLLNCALWTALLLRVLRGRLRGHWGSASPDGVPTGGSQAVAKPVCCGQSEDARCERHEEQACDGLRVFKDGTADRACARVAEMKRWMPRSGWW